MYSKNKSVFVRAMAATLSLLMLLPLLLCGCSKEKAVFSLGETEIKADMYRYWLSYFKSYFLYYYQDVEDTEEYWKSEISEGVTAENYIKDYTERYVKNYLCALSLFEKYSLKLSDEVKAQIDSDFNAQIEYYGSRSALNSELLKTCGITASRLYDIYLIEAKVNAVEQHLYGDNGSAVLTESELDAFFNENYYRVKYIYFSVSDKYVYDDKGNVQTDTSGYYKTEKMTSDEIAASRASAQEAYDKAIAGEDFNTLVKEYSVPLLDYTGEYVDGYYLTSADIASFGYTLVYALQNMKVNDTVITEDEYAMYVITRLPLEEKAYYAGNDTFQFEDFPGLASAEAYQKLLSSMWGDITIDREYIDSLSVYGIAGNINF